MSLILLLLLIKIEEIKETLPNIIYLCKYPTPPTWIKICFIEPNPYPYSGSQKSRHAEGKSIFSTIFGSVFKVTQQEEHLTLGCNIYMLK
jgi:hypothetical protein